MFTGLAEGQGTVRRIAAMPSGLRLSVAPDAACFDASDVVVGDSISISGCCLTVVARDRETLDFEAGQETLSRTNLSGLKTGGRVNLERALAVGARLGGHFVQGHVDGTAVIDHIERSDEWVFLWFSLSPELLRLAVAKGSIAVDGVSLTVVSVDDTRFSVALIPHTLKLTTLGQRAVGEQVNIETDILGKYVARLLQHSALPGRPVFAALGQPEGGIPS